MAESRERAELDIAVAVKVTFSQDEIHADASAEREIWGAEIRKRLEGMGADVAIGVATLQGFNDDGSLMLPIACRGEGAHSFFLGRLIGSIPEKQWSLMTEHVCGIECGASMTAIEVVLARLGQKLESGWRLVPPQGESEEWEHLLADYLGTECYAAYRDYRLAKGGQDD